MNSSNADRNSVCPHEDALCRAGERFGENSLPVSTGHTSGVLFVPFTLNRQILLGASKSEKLELNNALLFPHSLVNLLTQKMMACAKASNGHTIWKVIQGEIPNKPVR